MGEDRHATIVRHRCVIAQGYLAILIDAGDGCEGVPVLPFFVPSPVRMDVPLS